MKKIYLQRNKNKGFVILFAVLLSSVLLAIAFGVANIALKEVNFGTSAKNTNDAFFAADVGAECALVHDKGGTSSFVQGGGSLNIFCNGSPVVNPQGSYPSWSFTIGGAVFGATGLGGDGQGCAKVEVFKDDFTDPPNIITTITSRGYNSGGINCDSSSNSRVERLIEVTY